ncbi:MAG: ATP-binding protein [Lysobacterales bacterium]
MKKTLNRTKASAPHNSGKLRIGDDWHAITIIALSQSNPLKAVAEFVENSIDAGAKNVVITRGHEGRQPYLRIQDDGSGIPRDEQGIPNFRYVATHICDSLKRRMKANGTPGIQGEFGIGLLSFWTIGEVLTLTSTGADGKTYQMRMEKGDPGFRVDRRQVLFADRGTELKIKPLLPGIRHFSGEKLQWYLASELRDRIRSCGVKIEIIDRQTRRQYRVEPRQFIGRLLQHLEPPNTELGELHAELYLAEPNAQNRVGLYRGGTRVLEDITVLDEFAKAPWASHYLQGIVDAPFLHLTPGTRSGVIHDRAYSVFCQAIAPLEAELENLIEAQQKAEEERVSQNMLRSIRKAFREALLTLPAEEYDWFDLHKGNKPGTGAAGVGLPGESGGAEIDEATEGLIVAQPPQPGAADEAPGDDQALQKQFFEFAGPLSSARISPASSILAVGRSRTLRALARDRAGRQVEHDLEYHWRIAEGGGELDGDSSEMLRFQAPSEPGLSRIELLISQRGLSASGEAVITVTDNLLPDTRNKASSQQGLPGYTFRRAPGELWRSRYEPEKNLIVINNGHRDFVFASRNRSLKLRYISRLFAKEMVMRNFPGEQPQQLLERMIELSLYTEENLR